MRLLRICCRCTASLFIIHAAVNGVSAKRFLPLCADAVTSVTLQLFPLSPLVSHRLYENECNWGHLACKAAYPWTSSCCKGALRNCIVNGQLCKAPQGSDDSQTLSPVFRSHFFLLQQAVRKLIASSFSSALHTFPKLRFSIFLSLLVFTQASKCHQQLNIIIFKPSFSCEMLQPVTPSNSLTGPRW